MLRRSFARLTRLIGQRRSTAAAALASREQAAAEAVAPEYESDCASGYSVCGQPLPEELGTAAYPVCTKGDTECICTHYGDYCD